MTKSFCLNFNRPQFITRLKQTCSEVMDKCGFKAGVKGSLDGRKHVLFVHKQHKVTHSPFLTVNTMNTTMTSCCASNPVEWPCKECSHIWIQTQTYKHEKYSQVILVCQTLDKFEILPAKTRAIVVCTDARNECSTVKGGQIRYYRLWSTLIGAFFLQLEQQF